MKFSITQSFEAPVTAVVALYANPDFLASLPPTAGLDTPRLLSHDHGDTTVTLRWQHRYIGDLPGGAHRFVDPDKLTWTETTVVNLGDATASTSLTPDAYRDLIKTSVSTRFDGHPNHTTRTVDGSLRVRIPLVGNRAERVIVEGLTDYLDQEAAFARQQLG